MHRYDDLLYRITPVLSDISVQCVALEYEELR